MKWHKKEMLTKKNIEFSENPIFKTNLFATNSLINGLKDIAVDGVISYNAEQDIATVSFDIGGIMVCPCAITLQEVEVPFNVEVDEVFSFLRADEYDAIPIKGEELNIGPLVFETIMQEVPLKVVKEGIIDYPKGDGWKITSEEEYAKSKEEKLDPRLAVLKEFKFSDKEE